MIGPQRSITCSTLWLNMLLITGPYRQLLCNQLPRWLSPCSHHAAWESGPTEPETIWKYTGLEFHLKNWWKLNRKTFLSLHTPDLTLYYIIENASFMLTQLILLKSQSQVYEQGEAYMTPMGRHLMMPCLTYMTVLMLPMLRTETESDYIETWYWSRNRRPH